MNEEIDVFEIAEALEEMVKKGYLEKRLINNEWHYRDSKKVRELLKKGYTRKEISKILEGDGK